MESESKLRVLHLTTLHPGFDPRIYWKEARSLAAAGYEVHFAGPDAQQAPDRSVQVHLLERPSNGLRRIVGSTNEALRVVAEASPDIVHFHDPELLPVGILLRRRGIATVYDAHEDLTNQVSHKPYIHRRLRRLAGASVGAVERTLASRMSAVVAATDQIAARHGNARLLATVRNFPLESEFPKKSVANQDRENTAIYIGTITRERGILELVNAAEQFHKDVGARLVLAGPIHGDGFAEELAALEGWRYVDHTPWLDRREVSDQLSRAGCGLVTLLPSPSYLESLPVKMFEYMASGLPVVASDFPLWRPLVGDAGVMVDPTDPRDIAHGVVRILSDEDAASSMSSAGRLAFEQKYSWESERRRLEVLYAELPDI